MDEPQEERRQQPQHAEPPDAPAHPAGEPAEAAEEPQREPEPFSIGELRLALVRPHLVIEYVLGAKERLARTLSEGQGLWQLALLLLLTSVFSTVPYGALSPARSFWRIAVLYTGSLAICFPSLHVFAQFVGFPFALAHNLALSLVITSVAGLFTFAFFPIIWFIDFSTRPGSGAVVLPGGLSVALLSVSLLLGIVQMARCLALRVGRRRGEGAFGLLIACWLPLFAFITRRMAAVLGLI